MWAENAIESRSLGVHPFETVRRIARYYMDKGATDSEVKSAVEDFIIQCKPDASVVKMRDMIDAAISFASKHDAVDIGCVCVTQSELDTINAIKCGNQAKRLAFTLLCLAKYWNASSNSNSNWVNSEDTFIMRTANIKTSIKRQCLLYRNLRDEGLISFSRKIDCTNVCVNFVNDNDTVVLKVGDFRNLGNRYLMISGESYFECAECGVITKRSSATTGRKQKYCEECAMKVKSRQSVYSATKKKKSLEKIEKTSVQ